VGVWSARTFILRSVLYDITPFIEEDNIDVNDFYPATLEPFYHKGHYYSLPNDACSMVLFYNKDMFDKAGLNYPSDNMTIDEFRETARKLTQDFDGDGKIDQWGFVLPGAIEWYFPFVISNNGYICDPEDLNRPMFAEPESVEVFETFLDFSLKDRISPLRGELGDQEVRRGFQIGRIAMMFSGWWDMTDTDAYAPDLRYGVAPVPIFKKPATMAFCTGTGIYKNSPHPREAWEFVKFMTGKYGQMVRCKARMAGPSRRSVGMDPYFDDREMDKVFIRTLEDGCAFYGEHFDMLTFEVMHARDRVLQEMETVGEALKRAEMNYLRRIEDY
jgi:multiple sugar transport system substrate-binding protein